MLKPPANLHLYQNTKKLKQERSWMKASPVLPCFSLLPLILLTLSYKTNILMGFKPGAILHHRQFFTRDISSSYKLLLHSITHQMCHNDSVYASPMSPRKVVQGRISRDRLLCYVGLTAVITRVDKQTHKNAKRSLVRDLRRKLFAATIFHLFFFFFKRWWFEPSNLSGSSVFNISGSGLLKPGFVLKNFE